MPDRITSTAPRGPRTGLTPPLTDAQRRAKQAETALNREFNASRHLPKTAVERQLVRIYEGYQRKYDLLVAEIHRKQKLLDRTDDTFDRATIERSLAVLGAEKEELEPKLVDAAAKLKTMDIRLETLPVDESLPLFVATAPTAVSGAPVGSSRAASAVVDAPVRHIPGDGREPHAIEFPDDSADSRTQN